MTALPVAVASWLWTSSTVLAAAITVALLAVLLAHVLVAAAAPQARVLRRQLAVLAVPLLACFFVAVVVRLAFILIERPGP